MAYTCQNCGASAEDPSDLCKPAIEEPGNKLCGAPASQICNGKLVEMKYTCDASGSVSADADRLCNPSQII